MLLAHLEPDLIPLAALVPPGGEIGTVEVFQKAMRCVVRSGGCKCSHRTDRLPVVAVVVVPVEVARIEVEVPRVVRIVRIRRRGPVVAVRAGVVEVRVVAVAGGRTRYRAATFTRRRRESDSRKPSANFAVIHRHEVTSVLAVGSPLSFIGFAVWHAPAGSAPAPPQSPDPTPARSYNAPCAATCDEPARTPGIARCRPCRPVDRCRAPLFIFLPPAPS